MKESEPLPVALLRAPAALAAGAFLVGLLAGEATRRPSVPPQATATYLLTLLVCVPFLLPTSWYRRRRLLWLWMAAAAVVTTIRAVFMAGFLLPYQPIGPWLLKSAMDLLAAAVLWVAALAVKRD